MERLNCVLLVDDDKINNFLCTKLLKKYDICKTVRTAHNGEEALLYLSKHASSFDENFPELILLDRNMPEMNGEEFLETVKLMGLPSNSKIKIIILSASEDIPHKDHLKALGVIGYITKPLTEDKLMNILGSPMPA